MSNTESTFEGGASFEHQKAGTVVRDEKFHNTFVKLDEKGPYEVWSAVNARVRALEKRRKLVGVIAFVSMAFGWISGVPLLLLAGIGCFFLLISMFKMISSGKKYATYIEAIVGENEELIGRFLRTSKVEDTKRTANIKLEFGRALRSAESAERRGDYQQARIWRDRAEALKMRMK
jgi:flagellar biosynthesis component FlhA